MGLTRATAGMRPQPGFRAERTAPIFDPRGRPIVGRRSSTALERQENLPLALYRPDGTVISMDSPQPFQPQPRDTRNAILDAAEAVVARMGVAAMTFEEVAKEAGVSKGGVLYHFRSKE